jgi:16S rRNA (adenine(1408)-N(1))-methyltransferase
VTVDVGTGDGKFVNRAALAEPRRLVIGLDPDWRRMIPSARRRLPNALFVCASIEDPPDELLGVADEVLVHLPWGRLLSGVVLGDPEILGGLRAVARVGARLRVVVGTDIWRPPVPREIQGLPELTADRVDSVLADRFADHGFKVTGFGAVDPAEVPSSWARRLSANRAEPRFASLRAEAVQ